MSDVTPLNTPQVLVRCSDQYKMWDEVPDKLSDIPPENLSDEVTNIRCEMMYPDQLSDIPPPTELVRWSDQYKIWDEVPR